MFALDEFTEANGATRVALGSHNDKVDLKSADGQPETLRASPELNAVVSLY